MPDSLELALETKEGRLVVAGWWRCFLDFATRRPPTSCDLGWGREEPKRLYQPQRSQLGLHLGPGSLDQLVGGTDRLSAVIPLDRDCGWYTSPKPRVRLALHLTTGIVVRRVVFPFSGWRDVG